MLFLLQTSVQVIDILSGLACAYTLFLICQKYIAYIFHCQEHEDISAMKTSPWNAKTPGVGGSHAKAALFLDR
ncbi:hypothetical protein BBO01nite_28430 [Brevibacillus borstelensis]|nr:hypothetical protein BBO01nite_28430 [Brevibacillus borstelensis]